MNQKETPEKESEKESEVTIPKERWKRKPFSVYSSERGKKFSHFRTQSNKIRSLGSNLYDFEKQNLAYVFRIDS